MWSLTSIACSGDVNFSPTQPPWPDSEAWDPTVGERVLEVSGSLVAEKGACFEATILYDGKELGGARTVCASAEGCARIDLEATVNSASGHHTVSFQVLRQSSEAIDYSVEGRVLVTRENLEVWQGAPMVLTIPLAPTSSRLQPGDSVSFEFDFSD